MNISNIERLKGSHIVVSVPVKTFGCSTCTQASACISDIDISEKERQND